MLVDVDRLPEWTTTVVETRDRSHPSLQVGCTFRQVFRLLGRELDSEWRVTAFEPPYRVAYTATSSKGGRLAMTQTVGPADDGAEVRFEIDYELPGGFVGRMIDRAGAEQQAGREAEVSLQNLKHLLESDPEMHEAETRRPSSSGDAAEGTGRDA